MTRVWLVRHGLTTAASGIAVGSSNPPLSEAGAGQARRVAAQLADRPLSRIFSSDLDRALATARAIAAHHRLAVEATRALREIDFGAWEGRALADLWQDDPIAAKAWDGDFWATPGTFGESVADLQRRVELWWKSIEVSAGGKEIAAVGHRGSLAALRAVITGEPVADAFAAGLSPAEAVMLVAKN